MTVGLFASVTFFISSVIPPRFESEAQILILQKNMDIDAYRAAKSSEFAGEVLKRVITSSNFMNGVLAAAGESSGRFGNNPKDQMENWNDEVSVETFINTGVIKISVLDQDRKETKKIMEAVLAELQDNGAKYHGNESITLKRISGPVYFNDPAFPIIWLNVLIAAVLGIFVSIGLLYTAQEKIERWFFDAPVIARQSGPITFYSQEA